MASPMIRMFSVVALIAFRCGGGGGSTPPPPPPTPTVSRPPHPCESGGFRHPHRDELHQCKRRRFQWPCRILLHGGEHHADQRGRPRQRHHGCHPGDHLTARPARPARYGGRRPDPDHHYLHAFHTFHRHRGHPDRHALRGHHRRAVQSRQCHLLHGGQRHPAAGHGSRGPHGSVPSP